MGNKIRYVFAVLFLMIGILFLVMGAAFWIMSASGNSAVSSYKEPYCVVELEDISEIGGTYEGVEAETGYAFYELSFSVENKGEGEAYREMPSLYYEAEDYDAVYDRYYWQAGQETEEEIETVLFYGYEKACIPPGRTGSASDVLMIKDGTERIYAYYYPGYTDEELVLEIDLG